MDVSALTNNDDNVETEPKTTQSHEHNDFSIGSIINRESPDKNGDTAPKVEGAEVKEENDTKPIGAEESKSQDKDVDIETDSTLSDVDSLKPHTDDDLTDFEISDDDVDDDHLPQNGTNADCQWTGCEEHFSNTDDLVQHLRSKHIDQPGIEYICNWDNCYKKGIQQPNRFALISHIRSHTGENPFFCILPECSKNFNRADSLSQHIKLTHKGSDSLIQYPYWYRYLNQLKENETFAGKFGLLDEKHSLDRYSQISNPNDFEKALSSKFVSFEDVHNIELSDLIEPTPKRQKTTLSDINANLKSAYDKDDKEFRKHVASLAKDSFTKQDKVENLPTDEEIDSVESLEDLKSLYESLKRKYTWSLEVEQLITADLITLKQDNKTQWEKNQTLLDAHIELEVDENQLLYQLK